MAFRQSISGVLGVFLGAAMLAPSAVADEARPPEARLAQIRSHPGGLGYDQWVARWWQWALETPTAVNPIVDQTGQNCDQGQVGGVWFLGGTFDGSAATRACTLPSDTALFFPLVNQFSGAFLNDPPEQRTEEFLRSQVDCGEPAELLRLEIDGVELMDLDQLFVQSVLFDVGLPEDNVFGADEATVPELLLSPSASAGYHVFLFPLSPGHHVVRWEASWCDVSQDVTYRLKVLDDRKRRKLTT
jgi:hypothetical protein